MFYVGNILVKTSPKIIENQNRLWRPEGRKEEVEEDQGGLGRTV
jgi:hypothetical protein